MTDREKLIPNKCYACGKGCPTVKLTGGFNITCDRCGCETKPQKDWMEAVEKWNEGHIYPSSEVQFWKMCFEGVGEKDD